MQLELSQKQKKLQKLETLLAVCEKGSFTKAAEELSLTQPAVSHHIRQLEEETGVRIFYRKKGGIVLTPKGKIIVKYAKRMAGLHEKMCRDLAAAARQMTTLRVGITHTAESSLIAEVLAQYSAENDGVNITIVTETIHNLYEMLSNYEVDLAIVEGRVKDPSISALLLDTDYLVCVMSNNHPLARQSMVTIGDLRQERMILRLPNSGTRNLLESHLESLQMDLSDFNVVLEVDNIATIKDLIRKDMGISILARSACMDELRKGKLTALPIENLSMIRETNLLYHRDFEHTEILRALTKLYNNAARLYQ